MWVYFWAFDSVPLILTALSADSGQLKLLCLYIKLPYQLSGSTHFLLPHHDCFSYFKVYLPMRILG